MADDERCATCRFYVITKSLMTADHCRRFPPIFTGAFPKVSSDTWCGEWTPQQGTDRGEAQA